MKTVNANLLLALKSGEVVVTEAGRATCDEGLFWGDLSVTEAVNSGYVDWNQTRLEREEMKLREFNELVQRTE